MNPLRAGLLLLLLATAWLPARAADCIPLRVGYMDQNRPPYWLGEGDKVPDPPGAAVDLIHDAVLGAGFGCTPVWVRLPVGRIKLALTKGDIDLAPLGEQAFYPAEIALPRDKAGNIDLERALHNQIFVLVRASERPPANLKPLDYFRGKTLGIAQGNSYAAQLRDAGYTLDEGARDLDRNIEKLKLGRVDGVVVAAVTPAHLKQALDKYRGEVVQLPQPLLNIRLWLAFNEHFYQAHPQQCEALWTWLDKNRNRLGYVMQKYTTIKKDP